MQDEPWYGVKCIFRHDDLSGDRPGTVYEERVVVVRAETFEEALEKAEAEASDYVKGMDAVYLDYADVFHMSEERITEGTEVYSLMRTSDLDDDAFVTRYFDDGTQHSREIGAPNELPDS